MRRLGLLIATFGYIGFAPVAPGTVGSAAGVAVFYLIRGIESAWVQPLLIAVLFAAGVWAASIAERALGGVDPGPVVIDEVVGMLITTLFLPLTWTGWLVGFLVFRVCDVIKPFPAGRAERLPGGFGVMCDDVLAGVWGYIIMRGLLWAFPGWL